MSEIERAYVTQSHIERTSGGTSCSSPPPVTRASAVRQQRLLIVPAKKLGIDLMEPRGGE